MQEVPTPVCQLGIATLSELIPPPLRLHGPTSRSEPLLRGKFTIGKTPSASVPFSRGTFALCSEMPSFRNKRQLLPIQPDATPFFAVPVRTFGCFESMLRIRQRQWKGSGLLEIMARFIPRRRSSIRTDARGEFREWVQRLLDRRTLFLRNIAGHDQAGMHKTGNVMGFNNRNAFGHHAT